MGNWKYVVPRVVFFVVFLVYIYKTNVIPYFYEKYEKENHNKEKGKDDEFYNKCTYTKIPKVSGQLETAQYLRYTNSSLIRFGDGEILLIFKKDIPKEKYDPE